MPSFLGGVKLTMVFTHLIHVVALKMLFVGVVLSTLFTGLTFDRVRNHLQTISDRMWLKKKIESETIQKTVVTLNHEINNSLLAIKLASSVLRKNVSDSGGIYIKSVDIISNEADRIAAVVKKLKEVQALEECEYLDGIKMVKLSELK